MKEVNSPFYEHDPSSPIDIGRGRDIKDKRIKEQLRKKDRDKGAGAMHSRRIEMALKAQRKGWEEAVERKQPSEYAVPAPDKTNQIIMLSEHRPIQLDNSNPGQSADNLIVGKIIQFPPNESV